LQGSLGLFSEILDGLLSWSALFCGFIPLIVACLRRPYSILLMPDAIDSILDASSSSKIESKASSFDFRCWDYHLASILDGGSII
jgi:hypothetical protein